MKFFIGVALGWSIARVSCGLPIIPAPIKRMVSADILPQQLPAGLQGVPIHIYRN